MQRRSDLQSWVGLEVIEATSFDRLEGVIAHADPHALLAWIATEDQLEILRRDGDQAATLKGRPTSRHDYRRLSAQPVPSYAIWLIEGSEWIPIVTDHGHSQSAPKRCVSQATGARELQALFPVPAFNREDPILDALSIDSRLFRLSLERAEIRPHPADLSWDESYRLLLGLPELDGVGGAAIRAYGMVLEKAGDPSAEIASYRKFLDSGLLWSRQGEVEDFRPRRDVYYLTSRLVPHALREKLPILALPPSYPAGRVETRLGAQVVRHEDLEVRVEDFVRADQTERFAREAEELKYFAAAYRFSSNSESRGLPRLAQIQLVLCSAVAGRARVGEVEVRIELEEDGAFVMEGNTAFVLYRRPLPERPFEATGLSASVAEIFASVLEVQEQTTYMLLAKCAPAERAAVLGQLVGRSVEAVLEEMRARLPELHRPLPPHQRRLAPKPATVKPAAPPLEPPLNQQPNPEEDIEPVEPPTQVTAVQEHVEGSPPARRIDFRVKATPGRVFHPGGDGYWTVDAEAGEQLAERFEEASGRYPLSIGHLQGEHTLHCDLLSFRTAKDREVFQATLDHDLIDRMVEVKASASERGEVILAGGVARTALEYGERFFLYRIYFGRGGTYKLVEVQNPMGYDWPKSYRVNPFIEGRARHWDLRPTEESEPNDGTSGPE